MPSTCHRLFLIALFWRTQKRIAAEDLARVSALPADLPADLPMVTVQMPLYNEMYVAERLIDAVAALDWPADRLHIQILDD